MASVTKVRFRTAPLNLNRLNRTDSSVRFGSVQAFGLSVRFSVRTGSNRTIYPQNFMKIRDVLEEKMNKYIYFEVVLRCKIVILLYLSQMSMVLCHFFCVRKGLKITFKQYIECDEMLSI